MRVALLPLLWLTACSATLRAAPPRALPIPGAMRPLLRADAPDAALTALAPPSQPPSARSVARPSPRSPRAPAATALGRDLASAARRQLTSGTAGFRQDCSGFVLAALHKVGIDSGGSAADLYARAEAAGAVHRDSRPAIGDLVFFDNTYDRNGNGVRDDALSHIGVVIDVEDDGTVTLAHDGTSRGKTTLRMNLLHPHEATSPDGETWNGVLRASSTGPRLAGELFAGFATVRESDRAAWGR
ncbi:MAG: hypothetical protein RLZZ383_1622 [Pseudomonadota bacterium]|jgi:hypothetical protein